MQNGKTEVGREFIRSDRKPEGVQMVRRMVKFFHNEFDAINSWSAPFFKQFLEKIIRGKIRTERRNWTRRGHPKAYRVYAERWSSSVLTYFYRITEKSYLLGSFFHKTGNYLSSRAVSRQVFSMHESLTSVFGMGTGGASPLVTGMVKGILYLQNRIIRILLG